MILELNIDDFPKDFTWDNGQFPPLDALTYWHFLKSAKKSIEIGCGYSTYLAKMSGVDLVAIDPAPRTIYENIEYIKKPVQEVDLSLFETLNEQDILFVDSSHVYSKGSDVYHIIREILPRLKKGVLLQFHDYFHPDDYPDDWKLWKDWDWNEMYHVSPLEQVYEVLVVNNTVSKNHNEELIEKYPFVPKNIEKNFGAVKGTSIWFRV